MTRVDLRLCLTAGQVFRFREFSPDVWEGVDGDVALRLRQLETGVEAESPGRPTEFARARAAQLFALDEDQQAWRERLKRLDPDLAPCLDATEGLRLMRPADPVEVLFCFLCTANNHLARIGQMVKALEEYGEPIGDGFRAFPALDRLTTITESELRERGFGYRGATLPRVARAVEARGGRPWLESLRSAPYAVAHAELVRFPGLGRKLADCVCLFGLRHGEAVPVDTHIWQAAVERDFPEWRDKSCTETRYRAIGDLFRERYGELAGFAHQIVFCARLKQPRGGAGAKAQAERQTRGQANPKKPPTG